MSVFKTSKLLLAAALFAASPAYSATLIDTGTPSGTGGWGLDSNQALAEKFSLSSAAIIGSIEGFIGGNIAQNITVKIFSNGGNTPGAQLFSSTFLASATSSGSAGLATWQGLFGLDWALSAGDYWVGFEGTAPNFAYSGYMPNNAPNPLSDGAFKPGYSSSYLPGSPNGIGVRISSVDATAAVPEPATWAMLLVGFGAIGFTLRRRQQQVRVSFG